MTACVHYITGHTHILYVRSYLKDIHTKQPEFYEGDSRLPIFCKLPTLKKRIFKLADAVNILLHPCHNKKYYCQKVPTMITTNVAFLVDSSAIEDADDISSDDMGMWRNNGVDKSYVAVKIDDTKVKSIKRCAAVEKEGVYCVKRVYRVHGTDSSLKKITTSIYGMKFIVYAYYL